MALDATYYTQKKDNFFLASIILLACTLIVTIGLYGINWYVESQNTQLASDISAADTSLNTLKNDKRIQIYNLVDANKVVLSKFEAHSQIVSFIKHIKSLWPAYWMTFQGFDYTNGVITTKAIFGGDDRWIAYPKLTKFISDYRDHESIMDLLFINTVTGQDQIQVTTQFKVK